jgi:hypothetical protein
MMMQEPYLIGKLSRCLRTQNVLPMAAFTATNPIELTFAAAGL